MRTRLIVTLIIIGVASSACARSGPILPQPRTFDGDPTGSRRSTLTGTADHFSGDLLAPQMIQDGDGAAAIFPRTDVRGPQDVIGPGLNTKERALLDAAFCFAGVSPIRSPYGPTRIVQNGTESVSVSVQDTEFWCPESISLPSFR